MRAKKRNRAKRAASAPTLCELAASRGWASLPPVLDACCSNRAFWWNKTDERALFVDKRKGSWVMSRNRSPIEIAPDLQCDFTAMPLPSDHFALVVFDPPHIERREPRGDITHRFGVLNGDWRGMLQKGFAECFRVLRPEGVLIFKWNETEIPVQEILALTPAKPLFGHRSGKKHLTHWITFMKPNEKDEL